MVPDLATLSIFECCAICARNIFPGLTVMVRRMLWKHKSMFTSFSSFSALLFFWIATGLEARRSDFLLSFSRALIRFFSSVFETRSPVTSSKWSSVCFSKSAMVDGRCLYCCGRGPCKESPYTEKFNKVPYPEQAPQSGVQCKPLKVRGRWRFSHKNRLEMPYLQLSIILITERIDSLFGRLPALFFTAFVVFLQYLGKIREFIVLRLCVSYEIVTNQKTRSRETLVLHHRQQAHRSKITRVLNDCTNSKLYARILSIRTAKSVLIAAVSTSLSNWQHHHCIGLGPEKCSAKLKYCSTASTHRANIARRVSLHSTRISRPALAPSSS